jgi:hypothetical protein
VQTLAYNAGMFSRAQVLRRDGTAPTALGIADDLPDRMAYHQLNILAGMAGKVSLVLAGADDTFEYSACSLLALLAYRLPRYCCSRIPDVSTTS